MINWLSQRKFQAHVTVFLVMVISSIGMIFSMQQDASNITWLLVGLFAVANIFAVFIK